MSQDQATTPLHRARTTVEMQKRLPGLGWTSRERDTAALLEIIDTLRSHIGAILDDCSGCGNCGSCEDSHMAAKEYLQGLK